MTGLLRKYKISKISDNVKLTDNEQKICEFLDKIFVGLTRYDTEIDDLILTYYINSDNVWIFDTVHHNGYIYLNSLLLKPFFDNLRFDDYKEALFVSDYTRLVIIDWLSSLYDIKDTKIKWSDLPVILEPLGIKTLN